MLDAEFPNQISDGLSQDIIKIFTAFYGADVWCLKEEGIDKILKKLAHSIYPLPKQIDVDVGLWRFKNVSVRLTDKKNRIIGAMGNFRIYDQHIRSQYTIIDGPELSDWHKEVVHVMALQQVLIQHVRDNSFRAR